MPYRIAAPPEPDVPEGEEPYVAVLRAQRRRARLLTIVVVVLVAGGIAKGARSGQKAQPRRASTEAARTEVARAAIASARGRASVAQSRFEVGIREAIEQRLEARPDLGACPITLPAPRSLAYGRPAFPLLTVEKSELGGVLPSQAVAAVLADVNRAEAHLANGRFEEAALYARALDRPERFDFDVVLIADRRAAPRVRSGADYDPGEIAGRALVYDFASGRVVCAADVHAKSSRSVGYVFSDRMDAPARLGARASMSDAIHEDIRVQTERAIVESLRWRAGPAL